MAPTLGDTTARRLASAGSGPILAKRFPPLDGLRGLAILMVMLYHFGAKLDAHAPLQNLFRGPFRNFGWTGVDLFFVLSGFLITGILLDRRASANYFSMFYARRVLRILPLYYAALLVIWFVPAFNAKAPMRDLPWYAIFAQNWRALGVPPAGDFWSLAIEEQFYLVWPLAVYALAPGNVLRAAIAGIVACGTLRTAYLAGHGSWGVAYVNPFTRADALLWGAAATCLMRDAAWVDRLKRYRRRMWLAPLAAFAALRFSPAVDSAGLAEVQRIGPPATSIYRLGYEAIAPCFALLLVWVVVNPKQRFFGSSMMRTFGKYSYAAYVWHPMVANLSIAAEARVFGHPLPALANIPS